MNSRNSEKKGTESVVTTKMEHSTNLSEKTPPSSQNKPVSSGASTLKEESSSSSEELVYLDENFSGSSKSQLFCKQSSPAQQRSDAAGGAMPDDFKKSFEFDERMGFREDFNYSAITLSSTIAESPIQNIKELLGSFVEEDIDKDPIFHGLCPENSYPNNNECHICSKDFNIIVNRKKFCKFCGYCICSTHLNKKRGNPKDPTVFYKICDACEQKYLKRKVHIEFKKRKEKRDKCEDYLQSKITSTEADIKVRREGIKALDETKKAKVCCFKEKEKNINNKRDVLKTQTYKLETENGALNKQYIEINQKITEIEGINSEYRRELEALNEETVRLNETIKEADRKIEEIKALIDLLQKKQRTKEMEKHLKNQEITIKENFHYKETLIKKVNKAEGSFKIDTTTVETRQRDTAVAENKACSGYPCSIF